MPEFAPGELKSARAPITVKPAGLSCQTELYLASDGAKVATSGIKLFTSSGVKQDVSFPLTMPGEGAYPVYLDIFTNGLLIGAYKAVEDVVIAALTIITNKGLQIVSINGKKFIEVGVDPDGRPYGVLSEPAMVVDTYVTDTMGWTIHWRLEPPIEFPLYYRGKLRFTGKPACPIPVSYSRGWSGVFDLTPTQGGEGLVTCYGPYHDTCGVAGIYDGGWSWDFYRDKDGYERKTGGGFRVKNMLRIT